MQILGWNHVAGELHIFSRQVHLQQCRQLLRQGTTVAKVTGAARDDIGRCGDLQCHWQNWRGQRVRHKLGQSTGWVQTNPWVFWCFLVPVGFPRQYGPGCCVLHWQAVRLAVPVGLSTNQLRIYYFAGYLRLAMYMEAMFGDYSGNNVDGRNPTPVCTYWQLWNTESHGIIYCT